MRLKRQKKAKKALEFYETSYSFRTPYRVLFDAEFLSAALNGRVQLLPHIRNLIGDPDVKLYISKCVLADLEKRVESDFAWNGALSIAKTLTPLKCLHEDVETVHPHDCLRLFALQAHKHSQRAKAIKAKKMDANTIPSQDNTSLLKQTKSKNKNDDDDSEDEDENERIAQKSNKTIDPSSIEISTRGKGQRQQLDYNCQQYIYAIQFPKLREQLREIPIIPLIYLRNDIAIIEPPSMASINHAAKLKKSKNSLGLTIVSEVLQRSRNREEKLTKLSGVSRTVANLVERVLDQEIEEKAAQKNSIDPDLMRRKNAQGVNPLAAKKKKKKPLPAPIAAGLQKKKEQEKLEKTKRQAEEPSIDDQPKQKRVRNRSKKHVENIE